MSGAAGIRSADKLALVKCGGSESGSVFQQPADLQVWKSNWWKCNTDTYHTCLLRFVLLYSVLKSETFTKMILIKHCISHPDGYFCEVCSYKSS